MDNNVSFCGCSWTIVVQLRLCKHNHMHGTRVRTRVRTHVRTYKYYLKNDLKYKHSASQVQRGTYTAMRLPRTPPPHQQRRRCERFAAYFVAIIRNAQAPRTPTRSHTRASRPCLGPRLRPSLLCTYSPGCGDDIRHGVRRLAAVGRQWVRHGRVRLARGVCCCDVDVASRRVALGHICVGFTACIEYVFLCQCGVCEC